MTKAVLDDSNDLVDRRVQVAGSSTIRGRDAVSSGASPEIVGFCGRVVDEVVDKSRKDIQCVVKPLVGCGIIPW